jgi:aflatoxin B1 aldehyde reductase
MPPSSQKSPLNIIFGAMTFGRAGTAQARVTSLEACAAILDIFQAHGHAEIDTARYYGAGTSEEFLGALNWQARGLVMDTKFYPTAGKNMPEDDAPAGSGGWNHGAEHVRENVRRSLEALRCEGVDLWYLHGPDRTTPFEVTLRVVNELYTEGVFERFGISNYMAWEVAQICEICKREGYVMPTVYQGVYNALHRTVEQELFSCLRYYGLAFYAYNPLAGGYLTGRYWKGMSDGEVEKGSRFDVQGGRWQGRGYRGRYWNEAYFDALDILRPVAKKHGLSETECALRWMTHHSLLKREFGDGIIIGASSRTHIEENLGILDEEAPLPEEVVRALDEGWERCRGVAGKYWH